MKTKYEIIEELAKSKRVEKMATSIAHQSLTADIKDLCQMVYEILLEYEEGKLVDLWENNQIDFFLARIIVNQYRSSNSPYHKEIRKFRSMVEDQMMLTGRENDADYWIDHVNAYVINNITYED